MIYIYDILLNFIDGKRMYEFFEWNSEDVVEHIKRIPMFCVSDRVMEDILNNNVTFSHKFMSDIENKTIVFGNSFDNLIKYAFLFSNGKRCYAFELNEEGKVIYSSSLLLDEEEEVLEICDTLQKLDVEYQTDNKDLDKSLLTRREEKKKNFVEKDLIYTYKNKNYTKLKYLYSECFGNDDTSYKEKFNRLVYSINNQDSFYLKRLNFILRLAHNNKIYK
ncbi:MAG: hypothetical protein KHW57_01950 [Clostridium sp.]|jgi:hypothetical protein|nr:hypothetical protein [Clostridium sp.]